MIPLKVYFKIKEWEGGCLAKMNISKINSNITLDYLSKEPENLYLDRKRAKISLQDLANEIASFANANGGIIVVGITDDGKIEGFNPYGIKN